MRLPRQHTRQVEDERSSEQIIQMAPDDPYFCRYKFMGVGDIQSDRGKKMTVRCLLLLQFLIFKCRLPQTRALD